MSVDLAGFGKVGARIVEMVESGLGVLFAEFIAKRRARALAASWKIETEGAIATLDQINEAGLTAGPLKLPSLDVMIERSAREQERRHALNALAIVEKTLLLLPNGAENIDPASNAPRSSDWAEQFFEAARRISDEEMQVLWASLLAREAQSPNSVSLRTLERVRLLSRHEADLFQKALSVTPHIEAGWMLRGSYEREPVTLVASRPRVETLLLGQEPLGSLYAGIGLGWESLKALEDAGLISGGEPQVCIIDSQERAYHVLFGRRDDWWIARRPVKSDPMELHIPIYQFTQAGMEIARALTSVALNEDLRNLLLRQFVDTGFEILDAQTDPNVTVTDD